MNVDQDGCGCTHGNQSLGHLPPCPKAPPDLDGYKFDSSTWVDMTTPAAPREYWFHEDDNFSPSAARQQNDGSGFGEHKWKVIPYVEKSAWITENEKRNEAVALCSKMEAERDELKSELANSREAFGIIEERLIAVKAERDELRAKCEELEAKFKDTQDDWKRIQDAERALEIERQTNARLRAALEKIQMLRRYCGTDLDDEKHANRRSLSRIAIIADEALSEEGEG